MKSRKTEDSDASLTEKKTKKKSVRLPKKKKTKKTTKKKVVKKKSSGRASAPSKFPVKQGNNRGISHKSGFHPNSKKTQFQPGQSGNPTGRPPNTKFLSEDLREILNEPASDYVWVAKLAEGLGLDPSKVMVRRVFTLNHLRQAMMSTSASFSQEVWNRVEGRIPDEVDDSSHKDKTEQIREILSQIDDSFPIPPDESES